VDSVSAALRSVTIQSWSSGIAMLSIIFVPLLGIAMLRRWSAGKPPWKGVAIWLSGCSSLLLYACVAFIFGVCGGGEIGESGKSRLARAYGAPVIGALERYHHDRGAYPATLKELLGSYLPAEDFVAPEASVLEYPFEYRADSGTYQLLVRYTGPGMNECRYTPRTLWHCSGYF
jgi:hypothetical protein